MHGFLLVIAATADVLFLWSTAADGITPFAWHCMVFRFMHVPHDPCKKSIDQHLFWLLSHPDHCTRFRVLGTWAVPTPRKMTTSMELLVAPNTLCAWCKCPLMPQKVWDKSLDHKWSQVSSTFSQPARRCDCIHLRPAVTRCGDVQGTW